ncbi:hypothetical protein GCM10023322_76050 [Rugosimonospora acidiphila]|uniref:Uncharacterized protein n=1 Tax=Rugosimonospora acidiphila TaxID=556531 RepID=A0ABP9SR57_9ACTN
MRHLMRTAAQIAEQQLESLIIAGANEGLDGSGDDSAAPLTEVLVMGNDQRPYLVRKLLDRDGGGAQLCWVSVSTAGWTPRWCHPVVRIAVIPEPGSPINAPTTPAGARAGREVNERR